MCVLQTHLNTASVAIGGMGSKGPGRLGEARTPGFSPLPTWVPCTEDAPLVWNENQCHPCRGEHLSADWPALRVPPFRKDPGFYWLSVHAHVCACACLVTALPVMSFLSSWVPHTRCSSVFQPHTVTPTAAELLNVLLTCPSRETACARPPKSRVFSSTHPLTPSPVLFFSH